MRFAPVRMVGFAAMAVALMVLSALFTACGSSDEASEPVPTSEPTLAPKPTPAPTAAPQPTEAPEAAAEPEPTLIPTATVQPTTAVQPSATAEPTAAPLAADNPLAQMSPALAQLFTVVDWINSDPPDEATYDAFFSPTFVDAVPWDQWLLLDLQFGAGAPWMISEASDNGILAEAVMIPTTGPSALATIGLDDDGRVDTLLFTPVVDIDEPTSLDETIAALEAFGDVTWMIADPADCTVSVAGDGGDQLVPLGSTFKLYVLGTVVDAVNAGSITWDQPVTIRDELDSLPAGTTQDVPDGTELTVTELAELMITISDNTATDHLMELVGRDVIEDSLDEWGHHDPSVTLPFMTTREIFILKLTSTPAELEAWAIASVDERRAILAAQASTPLPGVTDPELAAWTSPISVTEAEWFATPEDLCRLMGKLRTDTEAARILALPSLSNSGSADYSWEGSKGGSEPGLLTIVTLLESASEDKDRVVVASLVNESVAFGVDAIATMEFVRDFALSTPG